MSAQTLRIIRESAWTFNTSGTGGLGLGYIAATGGELVLNDPAGVPRGFYYAEGGVGVSVGIKRIPKIGKIIDPRGLSEKGGGNLAPKAFWNHGAVYIMDGTNGNELTINDFKGVCCSVDLGAGVLAGYAGQAMLINVNPFALVASGPIGQLFAPPLAPKALVLSRGWNFGPQASAGISASAGYLWPKRGAA